MYSGSLVWAESSTASDKINAAMVGESPLVKPNCNSDWSLFSSSRRLSRTVSNNFRITGLSIRNRIKMKKIHQTPLKLELG